MGDHQRQSVLMRRPLVNEMDIKPADFGGELIEAVQRGLARPPVVTVGPVGRQRTGVSQRYALAPVVDTLGFRPTGVRQAGLQIIENVGRDIDTKRLKFGHSVHRAGNGERQVSAGGQVSPPNRRFLPGPPESAGRRGVTECAEATCPCSSRPGRTFRSLEAGRWLSTRARGPRSSRRKPSTRGLCNAGRHRGRRLSGHLSAMPLPALIRGFQTAPPQTRYAKPAGDGMLSLPRAGSPVEPEVLAELLHAVDLLGERGIRPGVEHPRHGEDTGDAGILSTLVVGDCESVGQRCEDSEIVYR